MKRQWLYSLTTMALMLWILMPASGAQSLSNGKGDLRVMTYNVYEGTDYKEVQEARTLEEFLAAVGQTIAQVRFTDPPARMQAIARQIIAAQPALVSLQELAQWSTGSFDPVSQTCGPVSVEFDMLPELMHALRTQGAHYRIAAKSKNWEIGPMPGFIPPNNLLCVKVVDHIAILARTDIPSKLQWGNRQSRQFDHILIFHSPLGDVPFARSWAFIDVTFNKKTFRFIGTHLDSVDADIRELQGEEIRLGPANTSLPVIVGMDSNAQAYPFPQDPTYIDFMAGGFQDAWSEAMPGYLGLTCCQEPLLNNSESELSQRIDLILTLGNVEAQRAAIFGADQSSKTTSGLWPSDHAGMATQLNVPMHE